MTATKVLQRDRVLQLLVESGPAGVTRWDAAREAACFELASRIGELEAEGCIIRRESFSAHNRFGDWVRGMRYFIEFIPLDVRRRATRADAA